MMKNPIGWIEIPVTNIDRAEKFYADFFGFSFQRQGEHSGVTTSWFPMDMESYGSATTLIQGGPASPSHDGMLLYFTAPKGTVEESLQEAEKMGITVLSPKTSMGEHGFTASIEDSEGNRIALHSMEG